MRERKSKTVETKKGRSKRERRVGAKITEENGREEG